MVMPCHRCGIPVERVAISLCCGGGWKLAHRVRRQLARDARGVHMIDDVQNVNTSGVWILHEDLCDAIVAARGEIR